MPLSRSNLNATHTRCIDTSYVNADAFKLGWKYDCSIFHIMHTWTKCMNLWYKSNNS